MIEQVARWVECRRRRRQYRGDPSSPVTCSNEALDIGPLASHACLIGLLIFILILGVFLGPPVLSLYLADQVDASDSGQQGLFLAGVAVGCLAFAFVGGELNERAGFDRWSGRRVRPAPRRPAWGAVIVAQLLRVARWCAIFGAIAGPFVALTWLSSWFEIGGATEVLLLGGVAALIFIVFAALGIRIFRAQVDYVTSRWPDDPKARRDNLSSINKWPWLR